MPPGRVSADEPVAAGDGAEEPAAMPPDPALPPAAKKNIDAIAEVERQLLRQRSRTERVGEAVTRFFGSLHFVTAHLAFIALWVLWNAGAVPGLRPFDPYPFGFLALVVGVEFILLTTFVLMNQNRQMARTEQWAHLDLQLSMLAEQEGTKNMQLLQLICERLRLAEPGRDREVEELTQATPVIALADEIGKFRVSTPPPCDESDEGVADRSRRAA